MLLILLAVASATPMVAFTAQPFLHDKDIGHAQVYVCDLGGRHRRQLTHEKQNCSSVQWAGAHSLCYVVGGNLIKRLNLSTGVAHVVFRLNEPASEDDPELKSAPLRLHRNPKTLPRYYVDWTDVYDIRGSVAIRINVSPTTVTRRPIRTQLGTVEDADADWVVLRNRSSKIPLAECADGVARFLNAWVQRGDFFYVWSHTMAETGEVYSLNELQGKNPKEIVFGNELEADMSKKWLAWTTAVPLWLKEGKVWFSSVGVMDWQTGKLRYLNDSKLDATSISLSPNAP